MAGAMDEVVEEPKGNTTASWLYGIVSTMT